MKSLTVAEIREVAKNMIINGNDIPTITQMTIINILVEFGIKLMQKAERP